MFCSTILFSVFCCAVSCLFFRIDTNGHGPIVEQGHLHVCSEAARLHGFTKGEREFLAELLIERDGHLGSCGSDVRRSIALFAAGHERELAHNEHVSVYIVHRKVHHAIVVVEDTQMAYLLYEQGHVCLGIVVSDAQEHEKASLDGRFHLVVNAD